MAKSLAEVAVEHLERTAAERDSLRAALEQVEADRDALLRAISEHYDCSDSQIADRVLYAAAERIEKREGP